MKRIKEIAARIKALAEAAEAIRKLAAEAKRELTEEEVAEAEKIAAEVRSLKDEREKLVKEAALFDEIASAGKAADEPLPRQASPATVHPAGDPEDGRPEDWAASIRIPKHQRLVSPSRLKAFRGPHAVREAYAFGKWFRGAVLGIKDDALWCADQGLKIRASMTETDNLLGGALVPDEFATGLIDLVESYGVFRASAEQVPMASDVQIWPRITSGLTSYFVGDNVDITASDLGTDSVELVARKLAALCVIPSELAADAVISLGDLVARKIAQALANKEDECGFNGTGTSTYGGIVGVLSKINDGSHAGGIVTGLTGNTAFSTLDLADFEACIGAVPDYPGMQFAWYISKAGWAASMMRLADAGGGATPDMLVNGTNRKAFLGYPVVWSQVLNKTLTAQVSTVLFAFGDLRMGAMFGLRQGLAIATDGGGTYFSHDQIAIRGIERFAINIHSCGDATTAGPIMVFKTPGA